MLRIGHKLRQTESSKSEATIEETPGIFPICIFGALTLGLLILLLIYAHPFHPALALIPIYFGYFAFYASIRSSFIADKSSGEFILKRKFLFWGIRKIYRAETISSFFVERRQKGSGLALRWKNGKKKILSMSATFDSSSLDHAASVLNNHLRHG